MTHIASTSGMTVLSCDAPSCLERIVCAPDVLFPELWMVVEHERKTFHFCGYRCEQDFQRTKHLMELRE